MSKPTFSYGLRHIDFRDNHRERCGLTESQSSKGVSLAVPAIYLGPEEARMHLTQPQARWLAALLLTFAATGELPGEYEEIPR